MRRLHDIIFDILQICQSSLLSVGRLELDIFQPQGSALTTTPWDTPIRTLVGAVFEYYGQ